MEVSTTKQQTPNPASKFKELGGVLSFDKNGSAFHSAAEIGKSVKHNLNNNVDLSFFSDFVKNGKDNYFPFLMEDVLKQSTLQKRITRTVTSVANGSVYWTNKDGSIPSERTIKLNADFYNLLKLTPSKVLGQLAYSNYAQGGSFLTMEWASSGFDLALARICTRPYKTARLSLPMYKDGGMFHGKHYYHRNWGHNYHRRNRSVIPNATKTVDWIEYNNDSEKYKDAVVWVPAFNEDLDKRDPLNRMQSYLLQEQFGGSDYYPTPPWFTATTYNYLKSEFLLSTFDVDDIENGFHSNGIVRVYHDSYIDPSTMEATEAFEEQRKMVEQQLTGANNSGSYVIVPMSVSSDGDKIPINGSIEFEEFKTTVDKDRHLNFDKRISAKVLSANGIIMPELVGVRDESSTLSEGGDKLINAVKLLNSFTILPQIQMVESFLNEVINPMIGIEETARIRPNLSNFLNLPTEVSKYFLHPEQFYDMYTEFGLKRPTKEQIESQLIPAYNTNTNGSM